MAVVSNEFYLTDERIKQELSLSVLTGEQGYWANNMDSICCMSITWLRLGNGEQIEASAEAQYCPCAPVQ